MLINEFGRITYKSSNRIKVMQNSLISIIWAVACDFQQCGILTSVDLDKPVQPPFRRRNSKCCSVTSLTVIENSSIKQML